MRPRTLLLASILLLMAGLTYYLLRSAEEPGSLDGPDPVPALRTAPKSSAARPPARSEPLEVPGAEETGGAQGRVVLEGGWGSGPDQLGRSEARESNPEGPMSLTVDSKGNLLILDQVNRRVQRFGPDGSGLGSLPIKSSTAQDVRVDSKGRTLVLDRLAKDPGIDLFGPDGEPSGRLPVLGGTIKEGGAITGVFSDEDGVYVEDQHDDLVRVADSSGGATPLSEKVPGRPTRDGKLFIKAGIIEKSSGRLYVQAHGKGGALAWETPITLTLPVLHILLLDSDAKGNIYLGAEVGQEDPKTYKVINLATIVARLDGQGQLSGTLTLPPSTEDPAETYRPITVGADGTIYHMVLGPAGYRVTAYKFQ